MDFSDENDGPYSPEIPIQRGDIYAYDSESEETEEYEQPSGSKKLKSTPTSHILADRTNKVAPIRMLLHNRKEVNPVQKTQVESIMGAIGKTNKLLSSVIDRMDKQETRMCQLEQKIDASSSLSSSASSTPVSSRRKEVPLQVRRETRRVYTMLMDEDPDNFNGWSIGNGFTYRSSENQRVVSKLVDEVRGLNPNFISQHIRDAAYRFYRTRCEERSVARRGLSSEKQKQKRRRERLTRKLLERQAALKQQDFKRPSDMGIWKQLMKTEFMSSEESGVDDDEEVLKVHDLPWRRDIVDTMFSALDIDAAKGKTAQSRRQMKRRVVGETSARPQPLDFPCWASTNYRKD